MARRLLGNGQVGFALHQAREAGDVLALRDQATGEVAGVAAQIVFADLDPAFADRRGPHEIDREPAKMGEAFARGRPLDGAADQRRGRAGVLVVGMPGAAGQLPRVKDALVHFDISGFRGVAHW